MTTEVHSRFSQISHLLLFVVILCPFASGKIIYVDDDAIGNNDGTSWENAYIFLQDALADAKSAIKRVEIRVAQGVYKPKLEVGNHISGTRITTSYLSRFQLINGVTLLGGYAGLTGPYPDIRDIGNYKTTLSGDLNGDDIDVSNPRDLFHEPTRSDNCSSIVIGSGTNRTAVLDGFIITGGFVRRHPAVIDAPTGRAGGMKNESGSPTINNCTFIGNSAESCGGGMLINAGSNPILTNCMFINNYAKRGGGVDSGNSSPTFINCTFTNNYADDGAGMSVYYSETTQSTPIELADCTFEDNDVKNFGGGLKIYSGDLVLRNCVFIGNSASKGGGMYSDSGNPMLTYCRFISNSVSVSGGGLSNREDCNLTMTNCLIVGNWAEDYGGGIQSNGKLTLLNCTIFCNRTHSYDGGGIYFQVGRISNSIIYGNIIPGIKGSEIAQGPHGAAGCRPELIKITHSLVGNDPNAFDITQCYSGEWLYADPLFANPGYWDANGTSDDLNDDFWVKGDYHLKSQAGRWDSNSQSWVVDDVTSPCIDAGDPNSPIGHEPFPNGSIINMGAYGGRPEASKSPSGLHAKYGGGTGEPNNPYLIYTAEQMNTIGLHEQDWHKHFKLMADIDLSAYTGTDFNIIGHVKVEGTGRNIKVERTPFMGVFDGDGHKISNFRYTAIDTGTDTGGIGIFKIVSGENAQIKNLGLINPDISGQYEVGSLAGEISSGTVSGCYVEGGNVSADADVGGLVGKNEGVITNCNTSGSVSGNYLIGGLVGYNRATITDCHSSAVVLGKDYVGGLVGSDWNGTITRCSSSGSISGTGGYVGGLLGRNNYGTVTACYSSAGVSGTLHVGGLVGDNEGTISNCFSLGNVTGTYDTGGLVGFNWGSLDSTITNCYSTGSVLGTIDTSGLVGSNNGDKETIRHCFWDIQTSEQSTSAGGTGKTTSEMSIKSTFTSAGWDFIGESKNGTEDIWTFYEGTNYPRLAWEDEPIEPAAPPPYGGGTGTAANPYLIYTAEQLNMIGLLQHDWGRHFKLMADIDLSGFTGMDFNIIGYAESFEDRNAFTGVFDGNGKTISNFSHTSTDRDYVALFAYIAGGNTLIKNLGMIDPNINAGSVWSWRVASLVAINSGTIFNCYVKGGTISGNEDVGGLVGNNFSNGTIMNCYSSTDVSGNKDAGGLVGENSSGKITYCYSTAGVSGRYNLGGLVGYNSGDIISSFWDIEASGQTTSSEGTGKTTVEMQTASTFLDADWDFVDETANGTDDIWWILEGQDYPRLAWETE